MRYVIIEKLNPGMKVGKNVYIFNNNGVKLPILTTNAVLTDKTIELLKQRGFKGIYIDDELSRDVKIEDMLTDQQIDSTMSALRSKKIESIVNESMNLVKEIYGNRKMTLDLIRMVESNDMESHALNVCELAVALGNILGFSYQELLCLSNAALLHDIGKYLSDKDLEAIMPNIPSGLKGRKPEEMDLKQFLHPVYAYYYLKNYPDIKAVTNQAILFSHENENGTGYPFRLTGNDRNKISKYSKILLICDKYEHYLKICSNPIEARSMLYGDFANGVIDKEIATVFLKKVPIYPVSAMIELSNGEQAIVIKNSDEFPERPVIRTLSGETIDLKENNSIIVLRISSVEDIEEHRKAM